MLMVTTTVGMLDGVHSHTTHLGPAVALHLVLVVGASGLQHGLVNTAASGNDANHGTVGRGNNLLGARWKLDSGPLGVRIVGDDSGVIARGTSDTAAVASLLLQVGHNGTLGHATNRHDVSHGQLGLLAAVDKLAGVHALGGDEELLLDLVAVGIPEKIGFRSISGHFVQIG